MRALLFAMLLAACGSAPDMDELCSDEPQTNGIYETQAGCPFEQQTTNILAYGTQLSRDGLALQAAGAPVQAVVQVSCGRYLMGKDAQGVAIILNTSSGAVLSHGLVHAGMPISALPRELALPLGY